MPKDAETTSPPPALFAPQVRLDGEVNDDMLRAFKNALQASEDGPDPLVVELTTTGGDADTGRRIADDLRLFRERTGRRPLFFGKGVVYSAGVTIMSGFERQDRWLSRDTSLLIHSRSINLTINLDGVLARERRKLEMVIEQIDEGLRLQAQGFRDLISGSDVSEAELAEKVETNWYLSADEALARRLVAGVV
ncbi:MAG TPA: ATP-dependent Clp protease proteolytic subunit [Phenylobacterium sp.]